MLPVPEAAKPIEGVLLIQVYEVPVPVKTTVGVAVFAQTTTS